MSTELQRPDGTYTYTPFNADANFDEQRLNELIEPSYTAITETNDLIKDYLIKKIELLEHPGSIRARAAVKVPLPPRPTVSDEAITSFMRKWTRPAVVGFVDWERERTEVMQYPITMLIEEPDDEEVDEGVQYRISKLGEELVEAKLVDKMLAQICCIDSSDPIWVQIRVRHRQENMLTAKAKLAALVTSGAFDAAEKLEPAKVLLMDSKLGQHLSSEISEQVRRSYNRFYSTYLPAIESARSGEPNNNNDDNNSSDDSVVIERRLRRKRKSIDKELH